MDAKQIEEMNQAIEELRKKCTDLEDSIKNCERSDDFERQVSNIKNTVTSLDVRMSSLEDTKRVVQQEVDKIRTDVSDALGRIYSKLDRIDSRLNALESGFRGFSQINTDLRAVLGRSLGLDIQPSQSTHHIPGDAPPPPHAPPAEGLPVVAINCVIASVMAPLLISQMLSTSERTFSFYAIAFAGILAVLISLIALLLGDHSDMRKKWRVYLTYIAASLMGFALLATFVSVILPLLWPVFFPGLAVS